MTPTVVPAIFRAKDEMSKTMAKMQSNVSKFANTTMEKFDRAGQTAFKLGRRMAVVGAVIAAPLVLSAKAAVDFEEKMSNVATLIDTSQESISQMGENVLDLSKKLPVPIEELTTALYDIRSAGIVAEKSMETLDASARLAKAGLGTVQEATNITTSALNAFKLEGLSAAQTTDILFKTVKAGKTTIAELSQGFGANAAIVESAGVKLADFSAATAALTTSGTPAAQAQNQIKASIIALQKPTPDMEKVFKKLGVTTGKELIVKSGSLVNAFEAVNKTTKELGLSQTDVFSRVEGLAAVISLTGASNEAYTNTLLDMKEGSNAVNEAFEKQSRTSKSQMQRMKNNVQALSITVGNVLLPIINDLIEAVVPYIQAAAKWISNNKALTKTIVKVTAGIAGVVLAISAASFAIGIYQKAVVIAGVAMKAFNIIASLNPFGLMVVAIAAVTAGVYALSKSFDGLTMTQRLNNKVHQRALDNTIDQRVEVALLFNTLRKAKAGTDEYKNALARVEKMQPGITEKYNLQTKSVKALNAAEKDLTKNIIKRAEAQARVEILTETVKERLLAEQAAPSLLQRARGLTMGMDPEVLKQLEVLNLRQQEQILQDQIIEDREEAANPEAAKVQNQNLNINITGLPEGSSAEMNGKKVKTTPWFPIPKLATNL
jgi:TP901 family phage tail tape measure protein